MKSQSRWLIMAVCLFACGLVAKTAPAAYYQISEVGVQWETTTSNRWQAETTGYAFNYGDDDKVVFSLPWAFLLYDQSYSEIVADSNGNIWFSPSDPDNLPHSFDLNSTGPVIAAWNSDLTSYAFGGVFIEHKADPERVVVEWQAETFAGQSSGRLNKIQAVLYQDGRIQLNYGNFADSSASDAGSGLSKGDGVEVLNLSQAYGSVPTLQGRTFLIEKYLPVVFAIDGIPTPVAAASYTVVGDMFIGATVTASVDTSAVIGPVTYPSATRWQFEVQQLAEGDNNLLVTMTPAAGDPLTESATVVYESGVAVYGVDDYADPTNQSDLVLRGMRETGATVAATDLSSSQEATVVYPTSRSWEAGFASLPDGDHNIFLNVTDAFANTAEEALTVAIDTLQPAVALDEVTGPMGETSLTVTGSMEEGATVAVAVDTAATVGAVTYLTATMWSVEISDLVEGDNLVTATAEDAAGNIGSATLTIAHIAPPSIAVTPAGIDADYRGSLQLHVSGLAAPGSTVRIEQYIDSDRNGIADQGEPVIRSFALADGTASANPNVQGDEDGLADGAIITTLNLYNNLDVYHAVGQTVFRVVGEYGSSDTPLIVNAVPRAQSIAGTITDGLSPLPGVLVTLADKWGREIAHTYANDVGNFVLNVSDPGDYYLVGRAPDHVLDKSLLSTVTVGSNDNLTGQDIQMPAGTYVVTGMVKDEVTSVGIGGIRVTAESDQYEGSGLTDDSGAFELLLPAGDYYVQVANFAAAGPAAQGYLGFSSRGTQYSVTADVTGIQLSLAKAEIQVSGRVLDNLGNPVVGMTVDGDFVLSSSTDPPLAAASVTNGNGEYCLGLSDGGYWDITLNEEQAQIRDYLGWRKSISTTTGPLTGNDLTAYPVSSWIEGSVHGSDLAPVADVPIEVRDASRPLGVAVNTAADGTFRLGTVAGTWLVEAHTEELGLEPLDGQILSLTAGETATVDFVLP